MRYLFINPCFPVPFCVCIWVFQHANPTQSLTVACDIWLHDESKCAADRRAIRCAYYYYSSFRCHSSSPLLTRYYLSLDLDRLLTYSLSFKFGFNLFLIFFCCSTATSETPPLCGVGCGLHTNRIVHSPASILCLLNIGEGTGIATMCVFCSVRR